MRTLKFKVSGQTISLDPDCDFTNLIPGTQGYLQANFAFSNEWDNCIKVAAFYSNLGREYPPQVIKRNGTCSIPAEALQKSIFKVQVIGQKGDYTIRTNKAVIHQRGGT